jgi:hypothetical protein
VTAAGIGKNSRRRGAVIAITLAVTLALPGLAEAKGRADLVVGSVSRPPASVEQTGGFELAVKIKNVGRVSARPSTTGIYLSTTKHRSRRGLTLRPSISAPQLRGRRTFPGAVTVTVPGSAARSGYYVIACADVSRKVRELSEANNCRAAPGRIRVTAAVRPPADKSSTELIDAAVTSHTITAETGLMYEVFASFGDPRLPPEYRGKGSPNDEILMTVAKRFGTLSARAKEALRPFFIPPMHLGSWWSRQNGVRSTGALALHDQSARRSLALDDDAIVRCQDYSGLTFDKPLFGAWGFVNTNHSPVKIWWQKRYPGDEKAARALAAEIDSIYIKLVALMHRDPVSDNGSDELCRGGDDRLDVSLVRLPGGSSFRGQTVPFGFGCTKLPVQILFNVSSSAGMSTLAHEFFHAIQFAYAPKASCEEYDWWVEASATWAKDYVYPDDNDEQLYSPPFFGHPSLPLETVDKSHHEYGAYLFPFYLARILKDPDLVRRIWENDEKYDSLEAIDNAVPVGFKRQWSEFARYNWLRPPVENYRTEDKFKNGYGAALSDLNGNEQQSGGEILVALNLSDLELELKGDVPHLAARYFDFVFSDETARSIDFYNGFSGGDPDHLKVQALVKIENQDWTVEDWSTNTSSPNENFCRDIKNERLEELVLIFSNSNFRDRNVTAPLGGTKLTASNVGCWKWAGSIKAEGHFVDPNIGFDMSETTTATGVVFRRLQRHGSGSYDFFEAISGSVSWTHSGTFKTEFKSCSGQLSGSYAIAPGPNLAGGALQLAGFVGSDTPGLLLYREYAGGVPMPWDRSGGPPSISYACSTGPPENFQGFTNAVWSTPGRPDAQAPPVVSADGMHLDGTFNFLSGSGTQTYAVTYTWHLTSQPEN